MSFIKKKLFFLGLCLFFTEAKVKNSNQNFLPRTPKFELLTKDNSQQWVKKCTPKVKLLNCGAHSYDMPRYSPYKSNIILSSITVDKSCDVLEDVSTTWEVWLVGNDGNYIEQKQILVFVDKQNYFVEGGSLYYGVYKIKLKTNAVYSNSILSQNSFCYFEMVPLPVQTVIVGGSKRQVYYKNPISFEVLTLVGADLCESEQGFGNIPPIKVMYEWQCDSEEEFCATLKTTKPYRTITGFFSRFKVYNFSLKVQTINDHSKPQSQPAAFQVVLVGGNELELSVECMMNCGGSSFKSNPQDIIHLEAKLRGFKGDLESVIYTWNYSLADSDKKVEDVMAIRQTIKDYGHLFIVKKNKLIENTKYIFSVSVQNSYYAEIRVETCKFPEKPNCTITPEHGIRGETFFNINCTTPEQKDNFLMVTYEFFDKYSNEDLGRHLGFSSTGILDGVVLTRNKLFVHTFNMFGAYIETIIHVELSPFSQNMTVTNQILLNHKLNDYIFRIGVITAYGDYLSSHPLSLNLKNVLITMLTNEESFIEEITGATLLINALHNIFCNSSNKIQYLKSNNIRSIARIMHHVSEILKTAMTDPYKSVGYTSTTRLLEISQFILFCSSELLVKCDYNFNIMDSKVHNDLMVSAINIMESLNNVLTAVAFKVLISDRFKHFSSKYINLVLDYLKPNWKKLHLSELPNTSLKVAPGMCLRNVPEFYVQAKSFLNPPFWWKTRLVGEINTYIDDIQYKHGAEYILKDNIREEFDIHLPVVYFKPILINGSVKQPNPKLSPDINDFIVAVHRIDTSINSKTFVNFLGIEGNNTLRAILLQDQRPDFDYMNLKSVIISNKSSSLNLSMIATDNELFIYLGILPGADVKIGETVNYTFNLLTASCQVRRYKSWMTGSKCRVSDKTTKELVICACFLYSMTIAGQVSTPKHDLNPFSEIPLLISVSENPFPIILIIVLMLLYTFLLLWMIRKDKKNKRKVNLIVLEDNDARDTCGYLVGVFTGSRIGAGTTSNVEIILLGEEGMSRSHNLKSKKRPTLQSNCDDWFLLYTHHHLGSLTNIIIWMDYVGNRPHWYCSKIFVCDLQKYDTDTFVVEEWFGINIQEIHLKTVQECSTYHEINNTYRLILENLVNGFRESHLWLSLFFRHPRSLVSSSQRLAVAFCSLFVTIGASVFIYYLTSPQPEDLPGYSISKQMVINGMISGLIGSLFSFITLHFFKSSYKLVSAPPQYHTHLDGSTMYHLERQYSVRVDDPLWLYKLKKAIGYIKPCRVIPVLKDEDNFLGAKINRRKLFIAFLLCIVISVLSTHFTIICGMRFGEIKSYNWFTSVLIAMIQTVCVIFPIKIVVTSLMFAVSKTRYFPLMSHTVGLSSNVGGYLIRRTISDFSERLISKKLKTSRSLLLNELELRRKQARIRVIWTSIYVFGCSVLIGVVCWLILGFSLKEFCEINLRVCEELDTKESCQTSEYINIKSYSEFLHKIENQMLPNLYRTQWYNGENKTLSIETFPRSGWLGNDMSRLIGPPRLRQIRVKKAVHCNIHNLMMKNCSEYFTLLSKHTEDKTRYNTGWVIDDWVDRQFDQTPWEFQDATKTMGTDITTRSGFVCHGGGYILSLRGTEYDAKLAIRNVIDTKWVDKYTRVLILEFTTYNVNKDVFTSVMFLAEATPFGIVKTFHKIFSVKLSVFPASGLVFLAYFFVFFVRALVLINIMGIGKFCKNLWNLQEIIILISYFVCVVHYSKFLVHTKMYRDNVDKQGKDIFFQVQKLTAEILKLRDTVSVMFCLVAFRMLRIIRFNSDVRQYLHDLSSAIKGIIWMWLVLSLFIYVQWRFIMFLVAPPPGDSVKDVLIYQTEFNTVINQYKNTHSKWVAFFLSLLSQIGMFSFACSLTHHYKKGQLKRTSSANSADVETKGQKRKRFASRLWESAID